MQASKRGQRVSFFGLIVQAILIALAVILWRVTGSPAALAAMWMIIAPMPLWVITLLLFYCRWLERREAEEIQQLSTRPGQAESIFRDKEDELRVAANRVRWMQRFLVPTFTLLFAGFHVVIGVILLRSAGAIDTDVTPLGNPATMFFAIGGAFAAFLFSRYAIGMSEEPSWRELQAPGCYLFTNSMIFVLLAVALAVECYGSVLAGYVVAYILPIFAIIIAAELVLNFVLDLYRPRLPDGKVRYSYDSRLLNLIANPQSIGHSIAEALNYQFGFEVSGTWFYRLLQRALAPLLLTGAVLVWLLTSVVVVEEGEQYVVLHWGKRYPQQVLKPRRYPYFIWPWPIDTARRFRTDQIHQMYLGVGEQRVEALVKGKRIYLWSEEHGRRDELDTLVAKPSEQPEGPEAEETTDRKAPAVNIVKLTAAVYYRINDAYKFGYTITDAPKLLEAIAHRELVRYAASATLLKELPPDVKGRYRPQGIMTFGRGRMATDLKDKIVEAVSRPEMDLGVDIIRVEIIGCHPPKDAAQAFQDVITAEREQDLERYKAEADTNDILSTVAGEPELALTLSQAITISREFRDLEKIRRQGLNLNMGVKETIQKAQKEADRLKEQIELERRQGRIIEGKKTIAQKLLARQEAFLTELKKIQAGRNGPELAKYLNEKFADASKEVKDLFKNIKGDAAVTIAQARADRWKKELDERARAETFNAQLMCLKAAPSLYRLDKYLDTLTEAMKDSKKYVLGVDRNRVEIWLNLEEQQSTGEDVPLTKERE